MKRKKEKKKGKPDDEEIYIEHGRSVSEDIPFIEYYDNGIFRTHDDEYCIVCSFSNTGYLSKTDAEKSKKNAIYTQLLCELPTYLHYQESIYNTPADQAAYERAIASESGEDDYEKAFFDVQKGFAKGVDPDHSIQKYYLTLSITCGENESAHNKLNDAFLKCQKKFSELDSTLTRLDAQQVFALLYRAYDPFRGNMEPLPPSLYRRGFTVKDYIAPDSIRYEYDGLLLGDSTHVKVMSISSYGSEIRDELIYTLLNNSMPISLTKHIDHVSKSDAVEQIKKQLDELIARKGAREEKKRYIPGELNRSIEGCNQLLDALSGDEELLRQTVYITVYAKNEDDMSMYCERIRSIARSQGCTLRNINITTREAFISSLPLGVDLLTRHQIMLSGEASICLPFAYEAYFDQNGFYYGCNYHNGEPVIRNRKLDKSCHGFVFGQTGAGKGMWVKQEMSNVFYQPYCKEDDIIVIDATGEYIPLTHAVGGKVIELEACGSTHLNPLHVSEARIKESGLDAAGVHAHEQLRNANISRNKRTGCPQIYIGSTWKDDYQRAVTPAHLGVIISSRLFLRLG